MVKFFNGLTEQASATIGMGNEDVVQVMFIVGLERMGSRDREDALKDVLLRGQGFGLWL